MKNLAYLASLVALVLATSEVRAGPILWVDDANGNIGKVDVATGDVTLVGNAGVVLTDIAFDPAGNLYGISFTTFYRVNMNTGLATAIGSLGLNTANALVFSSAGVAYTMGNSGGGLYTIDLNTGAASLIGDVGFASAGDLAFHGGDLYLSSTSNELVRVGLGPVSGTPVGPFSPSNVFGLANGDDDVLYAVAGTSVYSVDPNTGASVLAANYGGQGLGQAFGEAFFFEAVAVPEPGGLVLLATGVGLAALKLRRRA
ncbi:PEP-CTERM sorting domain-containing protein [Paludisphaera mucosa]|uniref:PEP-CTERM sorting domain-containing protein n=1 Tax=Paludisphaera mucosa TaxID=3030827 RepID=A0ABT6FJ62_9BACT|nr:PEP-CTERM sorting domain-containing protein [Paludisphaera mucosa]MDG3007623.1 PEP-CTERM sorting domain-containing protein [Paludisphaera mucosa]